MRLIRIFNLYANPFLIGAVIHYFSSWFSVPFTFIVGLHWIGTVIILLRESK